MIDNEDDLVDNALLQSLVQNEFDLGKATKKVGSGQAYDVVNWCKEPLIIPFVMLLKQRVLND